MSRSASASHDPRPRMACWRQGPGSPAASARIQPVLRRSPPSSPSRNKPAEAATRSWVNNGAIRALTARSDDAQSSSVVSIEIPVIHDLRIMVTDGSDDRRKRNCSARACLQLRGLCARTDQNQTRNIVLLCSAAGTLGICLLYTSDAADDLLCVDLGGRRIIK